MKKLIIAALALPLALSAFGATGGGTTTVAASVPTHAKPSAALAGAGAGLVTNGAHLIKCAYVTSTGITIPGTASDPVTVVDNGTNGKINVTVVASARSEVTGIVVYATEAAGSAYYRVTVTALANSNATYVYNIADATLITQGAAPTTDTASEAANTTITATSGKHFRSLWVHNLDSTNKVYITLDGSDPVTSATVGSWSIAAGATWGPIELPQDKDGNDVQYIIMRFDTTGGVVQYWYREDR